MKIEEIFSKIEKVNADIFLLEKENLDIRNKFEKSELGKQAKKQKIHMIIPDEFENNIQILGRKEEVLKGLYQEAYAIIEDHLNNKEYNLVKIYYEKLIEYGDPEASLRMGVLYEGSVYDGDFFEKDYKKALNYYKVSASLNNHSAMVNIGRMYGKGIGVDVDHEESLRWYLKSVKYFYND